MTKLLPFEYTILSGIGSSLSPMRRGQLDAQIAHINKVQRLLEWKEIEFYCMHWFKVRWPTAVLFQDRSEFVLGSGTLHAQGVVTQVKVWSVGGHVFSIESALPLRPLRTARDVSFVVDAVRPSVPSNLQKQADKAHVGLCANQPRVNDDLRSMW